MLVRTFTVIEALTLALWVGSLAGFAFVFAPIAFGIVTNVEEFGQVTAAVLQALTFLGTMCGGIAIVAALFRASDPAQQGSALLRIVIIVVMIGLAQYEARAIVPRMEAALPGLASGNGPEQLAAARAAFRVVHALSTKIYGAVFLLGVLAVGSSAAARPGRT